MVSETISAAGREAKRVSYPTTMPFPAFRPSASVFFAKDATARETPRTFSKVKSSAMTPRQPSVPNLISCAIGRLNQFLQFLFVEMLHDLAYILCMLTRRDEKRVIGVYDDEVPHTHNSYKLFWRMDEVAGGCQRQPFLRAQDVRRFAIAGVLVKRGPGAEVVPSKVCGDAIEVRFALALCRARFEHRVIDRDVFAFRVELFECRIEFLCPE